jgi:hypothetical protein
MLSPHEFAALMLVENESNQGQLDVADLDALLHRDLVAFGKKPDRQRARVTRRGASVLKAASRIDKMESISGVSAEAAAYRF